MRTHGRARARAPLPAVELADRLAFRLVELSRRTGIPKSSLSDLVARGELPAVRVSERVVVVLRDDWERFCAARRIEPQRPACPPAEPATDRPAPTSPARPRRVSLPVSQSRPGARR